MNSTMWTYFFMVIGILGIVVINLFTNTMITNEQDDFLLKLKKLAIRQLFSLFLYLHHKINRCYNFLLI